jgi:hypothetical protein
MLVSLLITYTPHSDSTKATGRVLSEFPSKDYASISTILPSSLLPILVYRNGIVITFPSDKQFGLCDTGYRQAHRNTTVRTVTRLKQRSVTQPVALVYVSFVQTAVDTHCRCILVKGLAILFERHVLLQQSLSIDLPDRRVSSILEICL